MTELVACLGIGKGSWINVSEIIKSSDWDKIFIITNDFGKENFLKRFDIKKELNFVVVNDNNPVDILIKDIKKELKDKLKGPEVALNIISGSGKIHTAVISSLLNLGLGIRFVVWDNGLKVV